MIETMNDQRVKFANCTREYDLLHDRDNELGVSFPKYHVNLYDDGASFPTLEFGLEEVLGPPLTTLPLVAPSTPSTLRDNTSFLMTFLDPPFPLA